MIPSAIEQKHKMKIILPYLVIICPWQDETLTLSFDLCTQKYFFSIIQL